MKSLFSLVMFLLVYSHTYSQIVDRKAEEAKNKANQRIENKSSETIDKGLDKIEKGIGNIFKKKKKKGKEETRADNKVTNPVISSKDTGDVPDFTVFKGSDFIPGKQVLFFEDFSQSTGQWDVNEWDRGEASPPGIVTISGHNGYWYKAPRKGNMIPLAVKELPDEFTLEFDVYPDLDKMNEMEGGLKAIFVQAGVDRREFSYHFNDQPQLQLDVHPSLDLFYLSAINEYDNQNRILFDSAFARTWTKGQAKHISIARNKSHVQLYVDGAKYIDLANGLPKPGKYTLLFASNLWGDGIYFTNIRLATGATQAKTEMASTGKFVTSSIYFDINSSRIRAASWPALQQAATAIQATTGVIMITGHTDSDGSNEVNLLLSQKRAEAVKLALVSEFGIASERLQTSGKGESVPLEPNSSAAGKAKNRRVEFIKQ